MCPKQATESWPVPPDRSRALDRAAVEKLITSQRVPLRERLLWSLLYDSAARSAEVLRLDVPDLDLANHRVRVTRKGGAHDVIVWKTRTARLLSNYLGDRRDAPVFLTERHAKSDAFVGRPTGTAGAGPGCHTKGPRHCSSSGLWRCSARRRRCTSCGTVR